MKKFLILIAALALMAMSACNEKPAKNSDQSNDSQAAQVTEQVDASNQNAPKIDVEKAQPTEDGKNHTVAEFNTNDYQVLLENLADGTYRLSLWKVGQDKSAKPDQVAETKKCVMKDNNYLMKTDNGTIYVINAKAGAQELTIMNDKQIVHHSTAGK